ncbi:MAG: glycoside hydrolase family 5 protein [Oscillospiraceae bacterium]|nr:glycoside hydrolase family 5 protein [Oscillospiraceae bacterium]
MKKRYIKELLIFVLVSMSLVGCVPSSDGEGSVSTAPPGTQGTGDENPPTPTPAPTPAPEPTPGSARPGNGDDPPPTLGEIPTPDVIMPFDENITAFELTKNMGAGWNLGNTLDAVLGANSPVSVTLQETSWGNPITTRDMIELLADTGFKTLRIPTTWERFIGPAPDYILDESILDRVQEIVDWAFEFDMYVIINTHHERWNFPSSDNKAALNILTALWHQIASRFAGYSEKLIFEAMNEPRMFDTDHEWTGGTTEARSVINGWNMYFINTVRGTGYNNEKRFLMIPTHAASADQNAIGDMWTPRNDDRVIVSLHAYTPYDIVLNTRLARNTFDPNDFEDTKEIDWLFERIDNRFISQGIAVVMGETGMLNKDENHDARVAWADYYTSKAAALGIPCVWWDNGIRSTTNNEAFGLMHRQENVWHHPEIAEAFIRNYR